MKGFRYAADSHSGTDSYRGAERARERERENEREPQITDYVGHGCLNRTGYGKGFLHIMAFARVRFGRLAGYRATLNLQVLKE